MAAQGYSSIGEGVAANWRKGRGGKGIRIDLDKVRKLALDEARLRGIEIDVDQAIQEAVSQRGTLDAATRTGAAMALAGEMMSDGFRGKTTG